MVLQPNPKNVIANGAVSYIINQLQDGLRDFHEELNEESKLDSTYIAARDGSAKTHADNAIRMLRWLYETEFGLAPPSPYTDVDVDGINPNIRQFEDGIDP
jgi:hypothetical protein